MAWRNDDITVERVFASLASITRTTTDFDGVIGSETATIGVALSAAGGDT